MRRPEGISIVSRIDEFQKLYFEPVGPTAFFLYDDRPGVLGTIASKLAEVRRFPSPVNDWVAKLSDQSLHEVITEHRELSGYLQSECSRLDLAYIESSRNFKAAVEAAVHHLIGAA